MKSHYLAASGISEHKSQMAQDDFARSVLPRPAAGLDCVVHRLEDLEELGHVGGGQASPAIAAADARTSIARRSIRLTSEISMMTWAGEPVSSS
jgi:hypothetical protein